MHIAIRSVLKPVHTWIGVICGLLLSVSALTGGIILFRQEFERAALARIQVTRGAHLESLDEAASAIAKLRPDASIRRVHLPASPDDPYVFQVDFKNKRTERIASDAATGAPIGVIRSGWIDWVVDLHRNLLTGKQGRQAVGFMGIVLLLLSVSGIVMWAAGAGRWHSWVVIRRQGSNRRFLFEFHRAVGLWALFALTVVSVTGMERSFPNTFRSAFGMQKSAAPSAKPKEPKESKAKAKLPLGDYIRIARASMPDGTPVELRLGGGSVELRLHRPGDIPPAGNSVYLDPASGAVARTERLADRPIEARLLASMAPIHYAQWGGTPVKIAWSLVALTPLPLFVTGLTVWWRPRKRQPVAQKV